MWTKKSENKIKISRQDYAIYKYDFKQKFQKAQHGCTLKISTWSCDLPGLFKLTSLEGLSEIQDILKPFFSGRDWTVTMGGLRAARKVIQTFMLIQLIIF